MNKKDKKLKKAKERLNRAIAEFELVKNKGTDLRRFLAAEQECLAAREEYKRLLDG